MPIPKLPLESNLAFSTAFNLNDIPSKADMARPSGLAPLWSWTVIDGWLVLRNPSRKNRPAPAPASYASINTLPSTWSLASGLVVPIPKLPSLSRVIFVAPPDWKNIASSAWRIKSSSARSVTSEPSALTTIPEPAESG